MRKLLVCMLAMMLCFPALAQEDVRTLRIASYRLDRVSGPVDSFLRAHPDVTVEALAQHPSGPENTLYLTVSTPKLFDHEDAAAFSLRQRWLDGQLGTEAFLRELDRMVAMRWMENQ